MSHSIFTSRIRCYAQRGGTVGADCAATPESPLVAVGQRWSGISLRYLESRRRQDMGPR